MTITELLDGTMRNEPSAGLFEVSGEQIGGSRDSHNGLGEKECTPTRAKASANIETDEV
jgi:hypothetical protein